MVKRIKLLGYKCYRCNHEWLPRSKRIPKQCPNCKSLYWNLPRRKDILNKIEKAITKKLLMK